MEQPRKAVVVTGFGPFGEHTVNASWIAVQELEKLGLGDSVDLHVYEIPVEYKTVQRLIPALWEKHSPQLVVHVGVSGMATTVTLEKCGHNKGYKGLDNCRFCPGSQCCVEDGPESIDSIIDMDAVCQRVTTLGLDVSVTISQDAGRATAAPPSSTCLHWASRTTQTSWAGHCRPSSRRCWMSWSSRKANSAVATNTESHSGLPGPGATGDPGRRLPAGPGQGGPAPQLRSDLDHMSPLTCLCSLFLCAAAVDLKEAAADVCSIPLCFWGHGCDGCWWVLISSESPGRVGVTLGSHGWAACALFQVSGEGFQTPSAWAGFSQT
ncbi:pyroglutamyl-peptidase 1 isoform X3 [Equus przewalskii]|uniref:Pyroglutamyl-peptidase I n=1 Tax=Equus przewalskii TaxID=9798 RepID=A0ABM4LQJ3_EQUPR